MEKSVFFQNYHSGVNDCLLQDLGAIGYKVVMPSDSFGCIDSFVDNSYFAQKYDFVEIINYEQFLQWPPMFILPACVQHTAGLRHLWELRSRIDVFVWLTATQDMIDYPEDFTDFLLTQDIGFHRKSTAKYKMLYLNRPTLEYDFTPTQDDIKRKWESKQINFFMHEFSYATRYDITRPDITKLRESFPNTKFYGVGSEHGPISRPEAHGLISESMFTSGIKHWETWGQTVNESMLLYTPTLHLHKFNINILKDHEINQDTALITETIEELIDRINSISLIEYENLCMQARATALQRTDPIARQEQLKWLLDKGLY